MFQQCLRMFLFLMSTAVSAQGIQLEVSTFSGTCGLAGVQDGQVASYSSPGDMVIDAAGKFGYIADHGNECIRRLSLETGMAKAIVGQCKQSGYRDGSGTWALFNSPWGLAITPTGSLLVTDDENSCIRLVDIQNTQVSTFAGFCGTQGNNVGQASVSATAARFSYISGIITDPQNGDVYVSDSGNNCIRRIDFSSRQVQNYAGRCDGIAGSQNGPASSAEFSSPDGLALDKQGNLFVAEIGNHCVRRISVDGQVSDYVGRCQNLLESGYTSGSLSAVRLISPWALTIDSVGNMFVSDYGYECILKVDTSNSQIDVFAGVCDMQSGRADGLVARASFKEPRAMVIDQTSGSMFIMDRGNDCIRKISSAASPDADPANPSQESSSSLNIGAVFGGAVGGLFLISALVIFVRKYNSKQNAYIRAHSTSVMTMNNPTQSNLALTSTDSNLVNLASKNMGPVQYSADRIFTNSTNELNEPALAEYRNGKDFAVADIVADTPISTIFKAHSISPQLIKACHQKLSSSTKNTVIIVKQFKSIHTQLQIDAFFQELAIMHSFDKHENIAKAIGFSRINYSLLMKYYTLGSLVNWLRQNKLRKSQLVRFVSEISGAMLYVHNNGYAHLNLKTSNIFIDRRENNGALFCVISDFTRAQSTKSTLTIARQIPASLIGFTAAEILFDQRTKKSSAQRDYQRSDIYAVAMLMYCAISGQSNPWPLQTDLKIDLIA